MAQFLPIHNPMVPYITPIPGGCQPGTMIQIQGTIPPHSNRFAVNIQCGPNVSPRDDVAFHINADLLQSRIVRNSISQHNWGVEEDHGYMPLARGQPFTYAILCEPASFNLAINGSHFTEMSHRLPMYCASYLAIDGDVNITSIQFFGSSVPQPGQVGFNPSVLSYPVGGQQPPYPNGIPGAAYPTSHQPMYPGQHTPHPNGLPGAPYPTSQQPMYPGQHTPYPAQSGVYPAPGYPHNGHTHKPTGILEKAGLALGGAGLMGALGAKGFGGHKNNNYSHNSYPGGGSMLGMGATGLGAGLAGATLAHKLSPKKGLKSHKKAAKKALKYGIPIAGLGVGAYTVGKILHRSSSSSSSSSSD